MATERVLNMDEMFKRFAFLGANLPRSAYVAMLVSAKAMLTGVTKKLRGEYLNVRTGHGWQSMADFAKFSEDTMQAGIDSDVIYMRAHEEGFHGRVQVPAHTAQHRHGRTLSMDIKTRTPLRQARMTKRQIARGAWTVRSHAMEMKIRARHFMRDAIDEQYDHTQDRIVRALVIAATTGQIPKPGQVGA